MVKLSENGWSLGSASVMLVRHALIGRVSALDG